jgi:hypothetical protein
MDKKLKLLVFAKSFLNKLCGDQNLLAKKDNVLIIPILAIVLDYCIKVGADSACYCSS